MLKENFAYTSALEESTVHNKPQGRSSIPDEVTGFSIGLILLAALWLWGRLSLYQKNVSEILLGVRVAGA
jgi:hypothetical protein